MMIAARLASLSFCLAAAVSFVAAQETGVTFASRAVPVTRLLTDYASATGKKVRAAPSMANDIVVVRLANADHEEFRKRLATAVAGRWTAEGDDQVLVPDDAARAADARKEAGKRLAALRTAIKNRVDIRKREGDGATWYAQWGQNGTVGAGDNLVTAFLRLSDAAAFARLKRGERLVYSSSPNTLQRPLPNALWPEVAKYVAEHNRAVAAQKQGDEEPEAKTDAELKMEAYLRKLGIDPDGQRPRRITSPPAKVLVAVQRVLMPGGGLSIGVSLYDERGKALVQESETIGFEAVYGSPEVELDPETGEIKPPVAVPANPNDPPVPLSEEARAVRDFLRGWSADEDDAKEPSADVLAKLKRPDLHDPMSFAESEALLFVAEHRKRNLIAALPDRPFGDGERTAVSRFLANLGQSGVEVTEDESWMVLRSVSPSEDRDTRVSRPALARLIAAQEAKGFVTLDEMAAFALATPGDPEEEIGGAYLRRFVPAMRFNGFDEPPNYDELRLYGSLTVSQRQALREGRTVPFVSIAGRARECLQTLLFGARVKLGAPQSPPDENDPMAELLVGLRSAFGGVSDQDYRSEPTEAMPRGLPADGYLAADVRSEPVGILAKNVESFGLPVAGGRELGMYLYMKSDPKMQEFADDMPDPGPMTLGERTRWNLRIVVAPANEATMRLSDSRPLPGGAKFTLQNLPAELRALAERTIAFMKSNPIPFMDPELFGYGRGVPPP